MDRLLAPEASYTLVTATTEHQFCNVKSLVYQFKELVNEASKEAKIKAVELGEPKKKISRPRLIIYDIGLNQDQQKFFSALKKNHFIDDVVQFDFNTKPAFWNPQKSRGQYAWRPGVIHNATEKGHGHIVVWVSPEISLTRGFMDSIPGLAEQNGGFVGAMAKGYLKVSEKGQDGTTHAGLFSYYKDSDPSAYKDVPMCSSLAMAFAPGRGFQLLKDWVKCAMNSRCIAPRGSNRRNHGFDLSALTYLAHKGNFLNCDRRPEMLGVSLQPPDPIECHDRVEEVEAELARTNRWLDRMRGKSSKVD